MKIILCLVAFVVGCFLTVQIKRDNANPPPVVNSTEVTVNNDLTSTAAVMDVQQTSFGKTASGAEVTRFICTNKNGLVLEMIDYGATVVAMKTPDREGKLANITLSCKTIADYQALGSYFGCTVGRYCNRIAAGKFEIDGKAYQLATNNGPHHLHGGKIGFDKQMWKGQPIQSVEKVGVRFRLTSEDGQEGYPGKLNVTAEYLLTNDDQLVINLRATTDKKTHVNLTNHNYWNLSGENSGTILDHLLKIQADKYLPVDDQGIPTGELLPVVDTPFDFTETQSIGKRLKLVVGDPNGYDHCYALRNQNGKLALAATVMDPASGRKMEIETTLPGIQFYTGNFLDGSAASGGFEQYSAFCLESQRYPDSPNRPGFPSTLLKPGKEFQETTVHSFSVEK